MHRASDVSSGASSDAPHDAPHDMCRAMRWAMLGLGDAGGDVSAGHLLAVVAQEAPLDGDRRRRVLGQHVHAGGEADLVPVRDGARAGRQRPARLSGVRVTHAWMSLSSHKT